MKASTVATPISNKIEEKRASSGEGVDYGLIVVQMSKYSFNTRRNDISLVTHHVLEAIDGFLPHLPVGVYHRHFLL